MGRGNGNLAGVGIIDALGLISDAESGGNKTIRSGRMQVEIAPAVPPHRRMSPIFSQPARRLTAIPRIAKVPGRSVKLAETQRLAGQFS